MTDSLRAPRHALFALLMFASACHLGMRDASAGADTMRVPMDRLATGVRLDPVGSSYDVGSLPLSMITSPDTKQFVLVNSGYADQGFQVVDRGTSRVLQSVTQPAAFVGAAFSSDGRELFVSGG